MAQSPSVLLQRRSRSACCTFGWFQWLNRHQSSCNGMIGRRMLHEARVSMAQSPSVLLQRYSAPTFARCLRVSMAQSPSVLLQRPQPFGQPLHQQVSMAQSPSVLLQRRAARSRTLAALVSMAQSPSVLLQLRKVMVGVSFLIYSFNGSIAISPLATQRGNADSQ